MRHILEGSRVTARQVEVLYDCGLLTEEEATWAFFRIIAGRLRWINGSFSVCL